MKTTIIIWIIIAVLFVGCDKDADKFKSLRIGDKFTLQESEFVSVAREDSLVRVYRYHEPFSLYFYYSTTRKDSIIYQIRSVRK